MHDDGEDHEVLVKALRTRVGWFHVRPVDSEDVWLARWRPEVSVPTYRIGGVTGTAEVDGVH